MARYIYS